MNEYVGTEKTLEFRSTERKLKVGDQIKIKNIIQVSLNENGIFIKRIK